MPKSKKDKQITAKSYVNQYILIGLTALSAALAFLYWQNPLSVYDAAGHVSLVKSIAGVWPKMSGWNANELLGWPAGVFYPPLFHFLAATLSFIISIETAIKLLVSLAMIALPLTIYTYTRSIFQEKSWALISTLVLFFLLLLFPNFLGTGFRSLFQIGLLSNFFALPFVFLFLASIHKEKPQFGGLISGVLLGILILTHVVASLAVGIYLVTKLKVDFLTKKKNDWTTYIKIIGLALLLTSFFWIPFILNLQYTSVSAHVSSYFLPNLGLFFLSILLGFYAWKKKEGNRAVMAFFASFLTFFAAVDAFLIHTYETSFFLYQFHIYRFQPFAYLIIALSLIFLASKYIKFDKWGFLYQGMVFGLLGLIALVFLVKNPTLLPNANLEITNPEKIEGRFIETLRRVESGPFWYGAQTKLNEESQKASWAYGLFTDSSPNGPYLGSLIRSLRPEAYPEDSGDSVEKIVIDQIRTKSILNLFGINYLVSLDNTEKNSLGFIQSADGRLSGERKYLNTEKVTNSSLFSVLRTKLKPVENNWDKEVENWWASKGEVKEIPYLTKGEEIHKASARDLQVGQVEVIEANEKGTEYILDIKADSKVPVLAKISYFPYWTAFDQEGKEIPLYRAAPNLILFEAKGEVTLFYHEPGWVGWLYVVTGVTFGGIFYLILRRRFS